MFKFLGPKSQSDLIYTEKICISWHYVLDESHTEKILSIFHNGGMSHCEV